MTPQDLQKAKDLGFATYLSAYVQLMGRNLGITGDDPDAGTQQALNQMALTMVEPMNLATEACWRALMHDHRGAKDKIQRFEEALKQLP